MNDFLNRLNGFANTFKPQDTPSLEEVKKQQAARLAKIENHNRIQSENKIKEEQLEVERHVELQRLEEIEANRPRITFVMTACGRPDLMEKTLDSFFKFNTAPIDRFIITEDSADPEIFIECKKLNDKKYNNKLEFIFNEKKLGQARSIDLAYSMIDTEYIFHCEEDWEFYGNEFIEQSISILEADETVLQAWIRPKSDGILNDISKDVYHISGIGVRDVLPKSFMVKGGAPGGKDLIIRDYMGFSWNPGVKRLSDYKLLKNGYSGIREEHLIDTYYRSHSKGFKVVSLSENDEQGFVKHIGWDRRADDPVHKENEKVDLEEAMLAARAKREADKKAVEDKLAAEEAARQQSKNEVKKPKVSVVMQVYLGDYPGSRTDSVLKFHRAVKSFLGQSYENSELIIASDGCKITWQHYEQFYADNKKIKFVYVDKKGLPNMYEERLEGYKYYRGVPRQAGCSIASGELITYMDSDDFLHPKFLYEIVYQYNNAHEDAVWFLNNTWYDHVNIMTQAISNLNILDPYNQDRIINIPFLKADFIPSKVKAGLVVNTPWLLTHKADIKTRWKDTLGTTSEDVDFGRRLREDYKGLGSQFSAPTYIRCHYTGLWDV
jgi:glycosyltransferase involved in cell wall biosynthesis